jgi:hypothetical protein
MPHLPILTVLSATTAIAHGPPSAHEIEKNGLDHALLAKTPGGYAAHGPCQ